MYKCLHSIVVYKNGITYNVVLVWSKIHGERIIWARISLVPCTCCKSKTIL